MSSRRELQGYLWTCYQFKLDARLGLLNTKFICSHFSISILTPYNKKRSRNLNLWIIFRVNNWKVETIASEIIAPIWLIPPLDFISIEDPIKTFHGHSENWLSTLKWEKWKFIIHNQKRWMWLLLPCMVYSLFLLSYQIGTNTK